MTEADFIKHYVANSNQIMWFLGAGTSRTAGMPTANDIIWDLKLKYYCREENQDIKDHDINNENIRKKIQSYMDSRGYPKLWSPEEYSFFFNLSFGDDYGAQQKYLSEQLSSDKISLNIGHRALAGLIKLNRAKIIFTTNFDEVIEHACVKVAETSISTFHLEGSYGALDALNAERFPIYAKIHGDFKYRSIKNLSQDLISNDKEIQKCFIAAACRYGLIVTGYSGRDNNVMAMFSEAIQQHNAFPMGLLWTVPSLKNLLPAVTELIALAQSKGINADIIEAGPFDSMMSRIWRQLTDRNKDVDAKVNSATSKVVKIPMGTNGSEYPVLRTNALPITSIPDQCAVVETKMPLSTEYVKELILKNRPHATVSRTEQILAWGTHDQIIKALGTDNVKTISTHKFENVGELISGSTTLQAFFERALVIALCEGKPLALKNDKGFVVTLTAKDAGNALFQPLKEVLTDRDGNPGPITGKVGYSAVTWSEAVRLRLEQRNGNFFLMLTPTIWIEPAMERRNHSDFVKKKRKFRYNTIASKMIDAWIRVLTGALGNAEQELISYQGSEYPAAFKINTRTSYSRK